ncbi:hypothetical protein LTR01_009185, partial [Friedmanniomyces endolithicus]
MRRSPATKTRHYQERKRGLSPEVAKQYQRIKDEEDELLLDAIADFTELAGAARRESVPPADALMSQKNEAL